MPTEIGHEEVRRMVEDGAQLVEVLPNAFPQEYLCNETSHGMLGL